MRPLSPRTRKSRFWDRRARWRTSSSALPSASRYSSGGRSSSSVTSSEPRSTVSGVRSSWDTSAMNCCCSFSAVASASSRAFNATAIPCASPGKPVGGNALEGMLLRIGQALLAAARAPKPRAPRAGRRRGPCAIPRRAAALRRATAGSGSPTPRTVWISFSGRPASSFLRSALMYTSMMLVERSKLSSQMRAWISDRETTLPRRRSRSSKSAPSRAVSRTVSPSRTTSRDSGS